MLQPVLESKRIIIRPFVTDDGVSIQNLAGDIRIAQETMNIPHPYKNGLAEKWISSLAGKWQRKRLANFAIIAKETMDLIGSVGFVEIDGEEAELGYWVGFPYWGKGYCTEAAKLLLEYGTKKMSLGKITARHLITNPNSGKVLIKLGFVQTKIEYRLDRFGESVEFVFYELPWEPSD